MENFHIRLKQVMAQKKVTQAELCMRTGIPKSAMSQYISGAFRPKQERTHLIAKALSVSEAWLMGQDDENDMQVQVTDESIKFALFNGADGITDEMFEEVKQFAEMVKLREETKRKK